MWQKYQRKYNKGVCSGLDFGDVEDYIKINRSIRN